MGSTGTTQTNGYLSKTQQLQVVLNTNPAEDDLHTWIREESDIMTFEEALADYGIESGDDYSPDFTASDIDRALQTGKIIVYSSKPIVNGDWVTPSAMEAASYAGDAGIYRAELNVKDVAWVDPGQGQLATKNRIIFKKISSRGLI